MQWKHNLWEVWLWKRSYTIPILVVWSYRDKQLAIILPNQRLVKVVGSESVQRAAAVSDSSLTFMTSLCSLLYHKLQIYLHTYTNATIVACSKSWTRTLEAGIFRARTFCRSNRATCVRSSRFQRPYPPRSAPTWFITMVREAFGGVGLPCGCSKVDSKAW